MKREYNNGRLTMWGNKCYCSDGLVLCKGMYVMDFMRDIPLGRIQYFTTGFDYIYAVVNGVKYDISCLIEYNAKRDGHIL